MRLTVANLRSSRVPVALNVCPTDPRFLQWLNEAQERMLNQGRFWGSYQRANFCITNGCVVLPREVAVIEQAAICGSPIKITNSWFNYTRLLATVSPCSSCSSCSGSSCNCGHLRLEDHEETAASFSTTIGTNKTIRTYISSLSDVGKKVIYQGYDTNGIWVRTLIGGVMSDGEQVTLANPYVDTTTIWATGAPTAVIKAATVQRILVYEYNTSTTVERQIAIYQPSELNPNYRKMFIPGFEEIQCCDCDNEETRTLSAIVSLQHVDLEVDNDFLILQNLSAYKNAMQAVQAYEMGDLARGDFLFYGTQSNSRNGRGAIRVVNRGGAIPLLQAELRKQTGDRVNAMVYLDETNRPVTDMLGFR